MSPLVDIFARLPMVVDPVHRHFDKARESLQFQKCFDDRRLASTSIFKQRHQRQHFIVVTCAVGVDGRGRFIEAEAVIGPRPEW